MRRLVALVIVLPVALVGTVIVRILLIPLSAPDGYDDFRTDLNSEIPALMQTHGVPGVAIGPSPRR